MRGFTVEWPLWGMRLPDGMAGLDDNIRIDDALLYQPTWVEWSRMESTAVIDEYAAQHLNAERLDVGTPAHPPVCLLRLSPEDGGGQPDPTFAQQQDVARGLFDAFRLHSGGTFVDPGQTGVYYSFPDGLTAREVQVFRSAFYYQQFPDPYTVDEDDVAQLAWLARRVNEIRHDPRHANAALAIENFRLSFGIAMLPAERALHLFIALEALLGRMDGKKAGTGFADRADHALPGARDWIGSAELLRDKVAHDLHNTRPEPDEIARVEGLTRAVLRAYVDHTERDDAADPVASFNKALA